MRLRSSPSKPLRGEITVAADKSISHRAVMLSAIANGKSRIHNLLEGEDVLATVAACRQMGVAIERDGAGAYIIDGVGLHGLRTPDAPLDFGNAGTALRLMSGLLCGQNFATTVTGDASLRTRPMGRIIAPLNKMGADISAADNKPPLTIHPPQKNLRGIHYPMPVASAQVKSCLLLAGLYAAGETQVTEPHPTRDHTERMLKSFGCEVFSDDGKVTLPDGATRELQSCDITVPADLSAAAFFLVAATVIPDSEILIRNVGINPTRNGVLTVLTKMGASITAENETVIAGEPRADLRVRAAALRGCTIAGAEVASAIDEIPALAIAAACADGETVIRDAAELRVKESDRIQTTVAGLTALGIAAEERADGMIIRGGQLTGGTVESGGDHRIAMAFAVAGGAAADAVDIKDCENIATSFPDFRQVAAQVGMRIDGANDRDKNSDRH